LSDSLKSSTHGPAMVTHIYNASTWVAEIGGSQVW
jgi:hypothetical protein